MSIAKEEGIAILQEKYDYFKSFYDSVPHPEDYPETAKYLQALQIVLSALRPITREQVEKVWRGEWIVQQDEHKEYIKKCSKCGFPISGWWGADKFCANCGAPMKDEAVDMVMERLEALHSETKTD